VSAIRRTGPRAPLSIAEYELPRPVTDPSPRKEFKTNPKHGLWSFFNADKTAMSSPEEEHAHSRAWLYAELSYKSFEDLHGLYWVYVKERNRIPTAKKERHRVYAGFGDYENQDQEAAVSVLTTRDTVLFREFSQHCEGREMILVRWWERPGTSMMKISFHSPI
jgi:large subunit ribosomal protein L47